MIECKECAYWRRSRRVPEEGRCWRSQLPDVAEVRMPPVRSRCQLYPVAGYGTEQTDLWTHAESACRKGRE